MAHADVVVIGAGSAGCALAARLSEDPDVKVVVLEAGGPDTLEAIHIPPAWPTMWGTEVDWAYETTPQAGSAGQIHQWPRGKVIGGSSSLNGMVYIRGNPADFDTWAYARLRRLGLRVLLPLFKRMEDVPGRRSAVPRRRAARSRRARRPIRTRSRRRSWRRRARRATRSPRTSTASTSRARASTTC